MTTLGLICIGDPCCPYKETIINTLLSLKENKHIDLQFTVGEALSCVIAGRYCQSATDPWNYGGEEREGETGVGEDGVMDNTLKRLLEEFSFNTAPIVRQVRNICTLYITKLHSENKSHSLFSFLENYSLV